MSRFLETSQYLKDLNILWDEHAKHIDRAKVSLDSMLKTASKIPSTYISTLKSITAAQEALIKSTNRLTSLTAAQSQEISNLIAKRAALLSNTKSLSAAIEVLESKLRKANSALAQMKKESDSNSSSQDKLKTKLAQTQAQVDKLTARLNASTAAVTRFGTTSGMNFGMLTSLMAAFGIASGVYLFAELTKKIFNTVRELESLDLAFRNVTGTQSEFLTQQGFLNMIAEKYGLEINNLTQQYTQWYVSAKEKLKETDIQQIFESIANAGANMGLSVQKQNSVFLALEQMMSKGTIQAEELKRQLGNALPGAFEIMVKTLQKLHPEMELNSASVMKMMRDGKIMSSEVLPEFARQMEIAYGIESRTKVETLNGKVNRLSTSWVNFVRDIQGSKNSLGRFFGWMVEELSFIVDTWGEILQSSNDKKLKELEKVQVGYSNLAKRNLSAISSDAGKQVYADEQIASLEKEKEAVDALVLSLKNKKDALITEADDPRIKKFKGLFNRESYGGREAVKPDNIRKSRAQAAEIDSKLSSFDEEYARINGLIDGYKSLKKIEDEVSSDSITGNGAKGRRERIRLNFDWIKSEYELKKAIIERQRALAANYMNLDDETTTIAKRLDARVYYTAKSLELLKLEAEEEKALNIVKYSQDAERNRVALKNKDITAQEFYQNQKDLNHRLNNEQLKADVTYSQKWSALLFETQEFSKRMYEKRLEYSRKTTKAEYDNYVAQTNQILARKNLSDSEWMAAALDLSKAEKDQAIKDRDEKLRLAGDEAEEKKAIWIEYGTAVTAINLKLDNSLEAMRLRRIKREQEIVDMKREAYGYKTVMGEDKTGFLTGATREAKAQYEELLNNYQIAVESGDEAVIAERKRQLDEFKEYALRISDYLSGFFNDFAENSGFKTLFDILGNKVAGFGKDWKTTLVGVLEVAQETMRFLSQNSEEYFQRERDNLDAQYEYATKLAGDNTAAKEDIDKQYEARKRAIARREAKEKRDMALFNIAVDTAQAIIGLWVKPGFPAAIPLAIAVGALGALQAAAVASKPLPSFFKGTDNAPEGFANTDEQGAELHLDKFGRIKDFGSNKGPRVKYLNQGDKIIPANKTKELINGTELASLDNILQMNNILYNNDKNNQLDATGIIDSIHLLKHSIENKETSEEVYDERGHTKYLIRNGQRIEDKNNRIRFKKSIL